MRTSSGSTRCDSWRAILAPAAAATFLAFGLAFQLEAQQPDAGLSPIRAQRIPNQTVTGFPAQAGDLFGWALATGDFNGDGRDELATGIPLDDGPATAPVTNGGALLVSQHFPESGLTPVKFVRQSPGLDPPEPGDNFGVALASCDFNHDGFDDLAVGVPYQDVGPTPLAGAVQVHYGRNSTFPGFGSEFFTQDTPGIPGDPEGLGSFGDTLACGDFDNDSFDDLVIGVPWQGFGSGMIVIVPGWSGGLAVDSAYSIDQDTSGIEGSVEDSDKFGWALAAGDFDGDGFTDLAVGAIGEDNAGVVQILFGSATGPNGARDLFWYDENLGGTREASDDFGELLAAGDFDGDGFDDLAIGVPKEEAGTPGSDVDSGEVKIAYGAAGGPGTFPSRTQRFTQDILPGAHETAQPGDRFGAALAIGDFNGDGFDDLAIGAPGEGIATAGGQDGHVTVVQGTSSGLHVFLARGIIAGSFGFPGNVNEHNKNFGFALATGDFDGDGHDDLAIGAPYESGGFLADTGAQTVLYGALFADGFGTGDSVLWTPVVP
jgi:hypothetical protein